MNMDDAERSTSASLIWVEDQSVCRILGLRGSTRLIRSRRTRSALIPGFLLKWDGLNSPAARSLALAVSTVHHRSLYTDVIPGHGRNIVR
jgi:hypothetical protein